MSGVGTTKVFEDDRVAIWELVLQPGESTPRHTHVHDYVFYVLEGASIEVFDADGAYLHTFEAKVGDAFAFKCHDGELAPATGLGTRTPATHSARNAGPGRFREILVETKR
jgi:cupin domain